MATEKAIFGAGCFWGVQAAFDAVDGVVGTIVGYAGGVMENPTYEDVCTGQTGHAEVVLVEYDPESVCYEALLEKFWEIHDPTTKDRQGPDIGSQYRSIILYFTPEQEQAALKSMAALEKSGKYRQGKYLRPIVTEILAAGPFYRVEEYHQKYFEKQGRLGYG